MLRLITFYSNLALSRSESVVYFAFVSVCVDTGFPFSYLKLYEDGLLGGVDMLSSFLNIRSIFDC